MRRLNGQSTFEYAAIITIVVGALTVMSTYVQRSIQANLKVIENQINGQPRESVNPHSPISQGQGCPGGSASAGAPSITVAEPINDPVSPNSCGSAVVSPLVTEEPAAEEPAITVEEPVSDPFLPSEVVPFSPSVGIPDENTSTAGGSNNEETQEPADNGISGPMFPSDPRGGGNIAM